MTTLDKNKAGRAAKQLIEANKESQSAVAHVRESVSAHIIFLRSAHPYYRVNELSFRETARKVAKIVEFSKRDVQAVHIPQGFTLDKAPNDAISSHIEEKNRRIFEQLNKVYSGELGTEEKDFLLQTKRYWRDRFADSE
jgi:hypothetical protein